MNLPIQAQPINRQTNAIEYSAKGVSPSFLAYAACVAGCAAVTGVASAACLAACAPLLPAP